MAQEELGETEATFRQIAADLRQVLWLRSGSELDGSYVSPAFEAIWGAAARSPGEAMKLWQDSLHPDDRERVLALWQSLSTTPSTRDVSYRILRPDGGIRWIRERIFPITDESGRVVRVAGIAEDITEPTHRDEEFAIQRSSLSRASQLSAAGEVVGLIAHEMLQPLGAMSNYTAACRMILSQSGDVAQVSRYLEEIAGQIDRCSGIVRKLRAVTKKSPVVRTRFDLSELVARSLELFSAEFRHAKIQIQTELAPDAWVMADRSQVQEVIVNLVKNAAEAVGELSPESRRIRVTTTIDDMINVSIADQGKGFTEESRTRAFESFFTTKAHSLGLGLPVSRSIIQGHGGRLAIVSAPGQPAIVAFALPKEYERK